MAADVRSLLRNERLARRIDDPHASYSSGGRLSCTVCNVNLKADSLWQPHTKSKEHRRRLQLALSNASALPSRPADTGPGPSSEQPPQIQAADGPATANGDTGDLNQDTSQSKKRKADDSEEEVEGGSERHKKARQAPALPVEFLEAAQPQAPPTTTLTQHGPAESSLNAPMAAPAATEPATVDEDEWAAFQRDVAALPSPPPHNTLAAPATIEAAPVSAAELAAQSREEESMQRKERKQEEAEAEAEDAKQRLEEEFDEMERLEERVKRLKEKREALRAHAERAKEGTEGASSPMKGVTIEPGEAAGTVPEEEDENDDDEDYNDFEGWGKRR